MEAMLAAADLSDVVSRVVMADALEESDPERTLEVKLLRSTSPVEYRIPYGIRPLLSPEGLSRQTDGLSWVNCSWGTVRFGGCWIHDAASAQEENQRLNYHRNHPHRINDGDVDPYEGWEMDGQSVPDCEFYQTKFGLDLDEDEVDELTEWVQEQSARVCIRVVQEATQKEYLDAVQEAYDAGHDEWIGCQWTTAYGQFELDLDSIEAVIAREIAETLSDDNEETFEEIARKFGVSAKRIMADWDPEEFDLDDLQEEWREAAAWLQECEEAATAAQEAAAEALVSANQGDWSEAKKCAEEACSLEAQYGDCPTWKALREACEAGCTRLS